MIRPVNFTFNSQTAVNNAFQVEGKESGVNERAREEFDNFVEKLRRNGIDVNVVNDTPEPYTPDSIFPNNWISFHENGTAVLYPMFAENRRLERKPSVIEQVKEKFNYQKFIDLSSFEEEQKYLEGTGSMVLDRDNKIAYACLSPRTNVDVLVKFCDALNFLPVVFHAVDSNGTPIYHTNVMMCVAERYVVVCLESIHNKNEKNDLRTKINASGKELIEISTSQMAQFAGNMLQVQNIKGERFLVMSTQAFESLTDSQIKKLSTYNRIIHSPLNTIEKNGGGSARCMMAEIF